MIKQPEMLNDIEAVFEQRMGVEDVVEPFAQAGRGDIPERDDAAVECLPQEQEIVHPAIPRDLPVVHAIAGDDHRGTERFGFERPHAIPRTQIEHGFSGKIELAPDAACIFPERLPREPGRHDPISQIHPVIPFPLRNFLGQQRVADGSVLRLQTL